MAVVLASISIPGFYLIALTRQNHIGIAGAAALARNRSLTELNVAVTRIGDAAAVVLAQNRTLTSLKATGNQIGDKGALALAANPNLIKLDLSGNQISRAVQAQLENLGRTSKRKIVV
jgi:hypothetical protein